MGDVESDKERFCAAAWPRLVAAVSYHCGDVHVAEELVQEALVRACRRWSRVSGMASPEGWAYRVAVNLATSRWRRQQAERRDPVIADQVRDALGQDAGLAGPGSGHDQQRTAGGGDGLTLRVVEAVEQGGVAGVGHGSAHEGRAAGGTREGSPRR